MFTAKYKYCKVIIPRKRDKKRIRCTFRAFWKEKICSEALTARHAKIELIFMRLHNALSIQSVLNCCCFKNRNLECSLITFWIIPKIITKFSSRPNNISLHYEQRPRCQNLCMMKIMLVLLRACFSKILQWILPQNISLLSLEWPCCATVHSKFDKYLTKCLEYNRWP